MTCIADLLRAPTASRDEITTVNGWLSWINLLNRPMFSCLHRIYVFIQPGGACAVGLPGLVLNEIALNVCLRPFWEADFSRPWWPFLPATDASASFGFGLPIARHPPNDARALAAFVRETDHHVRLAWKPSDLVGLPRSGKEIRFTLRRRSFKHIYVVPASI